MKAVIAIPVKTESISEDSLLYEGIEMAKMEVATNLWYNMNIKRIKRLVSFCMDYLQYEREGNVNAEEENDESSTSYSCYS